MSCVVPFIGKFSFSNEPKPFDLDEALVILDDQGYYQIRTLFMLSFAWGLVSVIPVLLPYFTLEPLYLCRSRLDFNSNYVYCEEHLICDLNYDIIIDPNNLSVTWVSDFNLKCRDSYLITLIASVYFLGMIFGNLLIPRFCETQGRKKVLIINIIFYIANNSVVQIVRFNLYLVFYSFISGIIYTGISLTAFVLNYEYSSNKSKHLFSSVLNSSYSLGAIFQITVFYLFQNWRINLTTNIIIYLTILLNSKKILESPTFLIKSDTEKLKENLVKIAHLNQTFFIFKLYLAETIFPTHNYAQIVENNKSSNRVTKTPQLMDLTNNLDNRKRFSLIAISWLTVSIITYGTSLNLRRYGSNLYINGITYYISNMVSIILSSIILNKFGCKISSLIYYLLAALSNFGLVFTNEKELIFTKFFLFMSGFSSSAIGSLNYIFTSELFPDNLRIQSLSFCSLISRTGGLVSPLINSLNFPTLVFSILSVVSMYSVYKID